jgi:hypothetical protein
MNNLHLQFDIMCVIISLLIILPVINKQLRQNISTQVIIVVSVVLICLGLASITYQHINLYDKITLEKEYRRYTYFGTSMLTTGICCLVYMLLLRKTIAT